jgi:hypothetical protein
MDVLSTSSFSFLVLAIIFIVSSLLSICINIQEYWLISKGELPSADSVTLEDIKKLRDEGEVGWAIKRFRQLPENRKKYTLRGAKEAVEAL